MGDHILESLSYNIYMDGSLRSWQVSDAWETLAYWLELSDIDIVSIVTYCLSLGCYGRVYGDKWHRIRTSKETRVDLR